MKLISFNIYARMVLMRHREYTLLRVFLCSLAYERPIQLPIGEYNDNNCRKLMNKHRTWKLLTGMDLGSIVRCKVGAVGGSDDARR